MCAVSENEFVVPKPGNDWQLGFKMDPAGQPGTLLLDRGDGWQVPGTRM
jgi:hypothetical protein